MSDTNVVKVSEYLKGRRHNSKLLSKVGKELSPIITKFNEGNDRPIEAEWSMSAKYQTGTLMIRMEDGDNMSSQSVMVIEDELSEILDDYFGYDFDEDEIRSSWASLSVGF